MAVPSPTPVRVAARLAPLLLFSLLAAACGAPPAACSDGQTRACYDGPADSRGVGACAAGVQACAGGSFGPCVGQVLPGAELCAGGLDEDCDGAVDDGCACAPGATQACYPGPPGTAGVGACAAGVQLCNADGAWAPCEGAVLPAPEVCNGLDDDCDGVADPGCACTPGDVEPCYPAAPATDGTGTCHAGARACDPEGAWGPCEGAVTPVAEDCATPVDEDCDGDVNPPSAGCLCAPGEAIPCYDGPAGTDGVGACAPGIATCLPDGKAFGACLGQVLPGPEDCATAALDEDCDGATDDPEDGCCVDGAALACYSGPPSTEGAGVCHGGTSLCAGTQPGVCVGEVVPAGEDCESGPSEDCVAQSCFEALQASFVPFGVWRRNAATTPDGGVLFAPGGSFTWQGSPLAADLVRLDAAGDLVSSVVAPSPVALTALHPSGRAVLAPEGSNGVPMLGLDWRDPTDQLVVAHRDVAVQTPRVGPLNDDRVALVGSLLAPAVPEPDLVPVDVQPGQFAHQVWLLRYGPDGTREAFRRIDGKPVYYNIWTSISVRDAATSPTCKRALVLVSAHSGDGALELGAPGPVLAYSAVAAYDEALDYLWHAPFDDLAHFVTSDAACRTYVLHDGTVDAFDPLGVPLWSLPSPALASLGGPAGGIAWWNESRAPLAVVDGEVIVFGTADEGAGLLVAPDAPATGHELFFALRLDPVTGQPLGRKRWPIVDPPSVPKTQVFAVLPRPDGAAWFFGGLLDLGTGQLPAGSVALATPFSPSPFVLGGQP